MRINSFSAHFDEVFASIFGRLPKPRLAKLPGLGWSCVSPSVVAIGENTPAAAYERWKRGWIQTEALKRPHHPTTQDRAA